MNAERQQELLAKIAELEAQLALANQLIPLVSTTCGRGNCNCVGSNSIKNLIDAAGLAPVKLSSRSGR
jgi:hypothetical protein